MENKFLQSKTKEDYYIGSNGNLIKVEDEKIDLPFIFGFSQN